MREWVIAFRKKKKKKKKNSYSIIAFISLLEQIFLILDMILVWVSYNSHAVYKPKKTNCFDVEHIIIYVIFNYQLTQTENRSI